jgi:hypothetical protein
LCGNLGVVKDVIANGERWERDISVKAYKEVYEEIVKRYVKLVEG